MEDVAIAGNLASLRDVIVALSTSGVAFGGL
jgi:hypothetical protein